MRGGAGEAFLGDDVLGHGFAFDIEIRKGAGAYICGEETAIFNSIEGYRGEPRNKPPFPVTHGLFGKPTVVNNVETLVNVLDIVLEGGPAYAAIGTEGSTGTKLFCVCGHVERPGVYEVEFGTTPPSCSISPAAFPATGRSRRSCSAARPAASSGRTTSTCRSPSRPLGPRGRPSARASSSSSTTRSSCPGC